MLTASLIVICKIYRGSKNSFAYILMFFTALMGFTYIVLAFEEAFKKEIILTDRVHYSES